MSFFHSTAYLHRTMVALHLRMMMKLSFSLFPLPLLILYSVTVCSALNITADASSLLALKSSIDIHTHRPIIMANWSNASSVCDWVGVTCGGSRYRRVIALDISQMGLSGTIPPQFGNLSFLISLNASGNNFGGVLPSELNHLRRLRALDFSANNLSGEVPSWFGFLSDLKVLNLGHNGFTGSIPLSFLNLSNLLALNFTSNLLEGHIPKDIGKLHSLMGLVLDFNKLSGAIPSTISNMSTLEYLTLEGNLHLSGEIVPKSLSRCSKLRYLNLEENNFEGTIPPEVGNITSLVILFIGGNNNLRGKIPKEIGNLHNLERFDINSDHIMGSIPPHICNISSMRALGLNENRISGTIPKEICNYPRLGGLYLQFNFLSGSIPWCIFNISTLWQINFNSNNLSGSLPPRMGYKLPNLDGIGISLNRITGAIPSYISNCSYLTAIYFDSNSLSGPIPNSLGELRLLKLLDLFDNKLTTESSSVGLNIVTSLANCRYLSELWLDNNALNTVLPSSFGNLSISLETFSIAGCNIMGGIPKEIGNLSSINSIDLSRNELSGVIPRAIRGLQMVQRLLISDNRLSGVLPSSICNLQHLGELDLNDNLIWGSIPECIGNVTSLRNLYLNSNRLNFNIPPSLWNLKDLLILGLSSNYLKGSLPQQIGNLKVAIHINLSHNYFSGNIPSTIVGLQQLQYIILANNLLQGSIPNTFASMISLEYMDLSNNNLTGMIPKSLETLRYLKFLNVSFNRLSGEIPSKGPFKKFGYLSFLSNEGLCGSSRLKVPPCNPTSNSHRSIRRLLWIVLISIAILIVGISLVILHKCKSKKSIANEVNLFQEMVPPRISYYELQQATQGFDNSNLLGTGSFGSVYKGIFNNGLSLAIKVFNSQVEGAFKSFDIECELLRNLRHRNLTKIISACSNLDFKALILQYMPHGSLDNWLYSENQSLDIMQRLNIMIDVACGLEYLHYGNSIPIVHCDLKPSNVLLDEDMVGHVSDFGISKLLRDDRSIAYTCTMATAGYIAPEYGSRGMVSTRCDVYSYGIMLMEVFTKKCPSNEMFSGDLTLKSWVYNSLSSTPDLIVDSTLLRAEELQLSQKLQCISTILELALNCTLESPEERVDIRVVLTKLNKIKCQLLTIL